METSVGGAMMRRLHRAYIAGFVDGEGSIGFDRNRFRSIYPRVVVANTNREILLAIQQQYGGHIMQPPRRPRHKQVWFWRLSWLRAVKFLADIQPWLRLKDMQAAAVFAWDAIRPGPGMQTKAFRSEHMAAHDYLFAFVRNLNRRGVPDGDRKSVV